MSLPPPVNLDEGTRSFILSRLHEEQELIRHGVFLANPEGRIYAVNGSFNPDQNRETAGLLEYAFREEIRELGLHNFVNKPGYTPPVSEYESIESRLKGKVALVNAFNLVLNILWDKVDRLSKITWITPLKCAGCEDPFGALYGWIPFDEEDHLRAVEMMKSMKDRPADYKDVSGAMVLYFKRLK